MDLDEQEVIDAVSQFVVLRTSDQTFTFLHNLIPAWLTDKKKASRKLFVDIIKAGEFFRDIIVEFLSAVIVNQLGDKPPSIETDLFDYLLRVGVRFLCKYQEKGSKIRFSCLTSYQYMCKRIQKNGNEIYSLIVDLKLSAGSQELSDTEREILQKICLVLESNVHVLQGSPHLLHSCLRNSPKAVRQNVVIPPDVVSSTWMECKDVLNPACDFPRGISCFALSPDRKLLAGGKGKSIFFFYASSLVKVSGPVDVQDTVHHLEFSPDGRFVFFGRLDKWFSLKKECVEEFPQFSGNCKWYKWASFVWDGSVIILQGDRLGSEEHTWSCRESIFVLWAMHELNLMESASRQSWESVFSRYMMAKRRSSRITAILQFVHYLHKTRITDDKWFFELDVDGVISSRELGDDICLECLEFEQNYSKTTLPVVRERVIDLYSEIFEYQVWDVQSGRPALEKEFSLDVGLSPCSNLCHVASALESNEALFSIIYKEGLSFFYVALLNFLSCFLRKLWDCDFYRSFWQESFCVTNLPIEFQNRPAMESRLSMSLDGTWIAVRRDSTVCLFNNRNLEYFDFGTPVHTIEDAEKFAFTDDSCVFLYFTSHRSLHALCLQTYTILSSTAGVIPLYCTPEDHVGYFFHAKDEEKIIFAREFPRSFLSLFSSNERPLTVAFSSPDTMCTLFSDCTVASWKTSGVEGPP